MAQIIKLSNKNIVHTNCYFIAENLDEAHEIVKYFKNDYKQ